MYGVVKNSESSELTQSIIPLILNIIYGYEKHVSRVL